MPTGEPGIRPSQNSLLLLLLLTGNGLLAMGTGVLLTGFNTLVTTVEAGLKPGGKTPNPCGPDTSTVPTVGTIERLSGVPRCTS